MHKLLTTTSLALLLAAPAYAQSVSGTTEGAVGAATGAATGATTGATAEASSDTSATTQGSTKVTTDATTGTSTEAEADAEMKAEGEAEADTKTDMSAEADSKADTSTSAEANSELDIPSPWDAPNVEISGYDTVKVDALTASDIEGARVYGVNNEDIGEVADLVLSEDGKIDKALVDVGGFLGIGEKRVAVAFEEMQVMRSNDADLRIYIGATQEDLEQRPEYDG